MKIINFFGAPGVGKTTNALLLTGYLKQLGIDAEMSSEFIKQYIFSDNQDMVNFPNHLFAGQEMNLRLFLNSNEVEFVVTDAPLPITAFYASEDSETSFKPFAFEAFNKYDNVNFFINRNHNYSHQGRIHNEKESILKNQQIKAFLINNNIPFIEINSTDDLKDFVLPFILRNHRVEGYLENKRVRG